MYKLMKFAILIFAVITLAACFGGGKTRYRDDPNAVTVDPAIAAERDAALAARDKARAERDAAVTEFGDDFSGSTTTDRLRLAAVTRVPRITGQLLNFFDSFNAHQDAGYSRNVAYNIGTLDRGTHNPNYLRIRTDAQLYPRDGDNPMLFARTGSSTLEFPGRGDVFRTNSFTDTRYPGTRLTIQGTENAADPYVWRNWEHEVITSFQFTRSGDNPGMVMNFGAADITNAEGVVTGKTGAIFSDLETYAAKGCSSGNDRHCNVQNTHDISIGFGANRHRNPNDGLAYYWKALTPNHRNDQFDRLTGGTPSVLMPGETASTQGGGSAFVLTTPTYTVTQDVGNYTLELTHAATSVANSADADNQRYLSYAAYGLFHFFDRYTNPDRLGRMQTISYGFDAFADADNMRTTDLTGANTIEATFKGRTIAYLVFLGGGSSANRVVQSLVRMRGDIQLTANIGATGADANTITGSISSLEYILPGRRSWSQEDFHSIGDNVNGTSFNYTTAFGADTAILNLTGGTIAADGSYTGTVTPTTDPATYFDAGAFKGNLYGPLDGLETAGTWYLPAADTRAGADIGVGGIIGSFGACQDGNGRC